MRATSVKQHARSVKGKGNTTVRKHYRKGGAKTKDLTSSMAAKHGSLMDMVGTSKTCKSCGKKGGCDCKKGKGITMITKHSKRENKAKKKALYMENGKTILMEGAGSPAAMKKGRQYPLSHEAIKKVSRNKKGKSC